MRYDELEQKTTALLEQPPLSRTVVIEACSRFSELLNGGAYDEKIREYGMEKLLTGEMISRAASLLRADALKKRVETELSGFQNQFLMPLGVLMHVTAGNMTGIGAYSVLEGLLAGNINLLKLSSADDGLSVFLLRELIRIEPVLADYIYTFRIPSGDRERILKLLTLSDGVCTWGGDEAVRGIRSLAPAGTKLIEWGHRLSFACVTRACTEREEALQAVADHMIRTNQLLCSSCQGIYVEAEGREAEEFCRRFLKLLEYSCEKYGNKEAGFRGLSTIRMYRKELETAMTGEHMFRGRRGQCYPGGRSEASAVTDVWKLLGEAGEPGETRGNPEKRQGKAPDREAGLPGGRRAGDGPDTGQGRSQPDSDRTGTGFRSVF